MIGRPGRYFQSYDLPSSWQENSGCCQESLGSFLAKAHWASQLTTAAFESAFMPLGFVMKMMKRPTDLTKVHDCTFLHHLMLPSLSVHRPHQSCRLLRGSVLQALEKRTFPVFSVLWCFSFHRTCINVLIEQKGKVLEKRPLRLEKT